MKDVLLYLFGLPGVFFILFLFVAFYLFTSRISRARTFAVVLFVTVLLFSNVFVGKFLASFLVQGVEFKQIRSLTEIDMIVMPTQGVNYNGEITGWAPNQDSFKAANIAYFLQAKLADRKVPVLMCGGQMEGNDTDKAEADIVRDYFAGQTAQVRKTLTETISKNLYEQVWQCAAILKRHGAKNPALVTNELKMLRTLALFRARGVEAIPFPVFAIKKERSEFSEFLPSLEGIMLNRSVIKEYIELALDYLNDKVNSEHFAYNTQDTNIRK
tara:strand:- start:1026 stop:1838 length:813 start_codon:yes stop_codon:yes gene_type:complete